MPAKLYIFCGIPFSGKSTLSKDIAKRTDYTRIDLDEVKFDLYGKDTADLDLQQEDWDIIYQEMYKRIEAALKAEKTVIHDTGNFTRYERGLVRNIANKLGLEAVTIFVDTPEEVARQRLLANRTTNQRFNMADEEFEEAVAEMEVPGADEHTIVYRQEVPLEDWIERHFSS